MPMQPCELQCNNSVSWKDLPHPDLQQFNLQWERNNFINFFSESYLVVAKFHAAILETTFLQNCDLCER